MQNLQELFTAEDLKKVSSFQAALAQKEKAYAKKRSQEGKETYQAIRELKQQWEDTADKEAFLSDFHLSQAEESLKTMTQTPLAKQEPLVKQGWGSKVKSAVLWPARVLWSAVRWPLMLLPAGGVVAHVGDSIDKNILQTGRDFEIDKRYANPTAYEKQKIPAHWGWGKYVIPGVLGAGAAALTGGLVLPMMGSYMLSVPGFMALAGGLTAAGAYSRMRTQERTMAEKAEKAQTTWGKVKQALKKQWPLVALGVAGGSAAFLGLGGLVSGLVGTQAPGWLATAVNATVAGITGLCGAGAVVGSVAKQTKDWKDLKDKYGKNWLQQQKQAEKQALNLLSKHQKQRKLWWHVAKPILVAGSVAGALAVGFFTGGYSLVINGLSGVNMGALGICLAKSVGTLAAGLGLVKGTDMLVAGGEGNQLMVQAEQKANTIARQSKALPQKRNDRDNALSEQTLVEANTPKVVRKTKSNAYIRNMKGNNTYTAA